MPERFPRRCNEPGCLTKTTDRSGYCEAHRKDNARSRTRAVYDAERHSDPVYRLYNSATWERFKTMLRGRGNVLCQRLIHGRQCMRPVEIFHHLASPREKPELMYSPGNVIGLCRQCHPPDEGTPWWVEGKDYVATEWTEIYVGS
jgi:5-methylcytosine-specific restriction protein A